MKLSKYVDRGENKYNEDQGRFTNKQFEELKKLIKTPTINRGDTKTLHRLAENLEKYKIKIISFKKF